MLGLEIDDQFEFRRLLHAEVGEPRVVYGLIVSPSSSITRRCVSAVHVRTSVLEAGFKA